MKFIFGMQINIKVLFKLILSFWVCAPGMPKLPEIRSLHILAIFLEKHGGEVKFFACKLTRKFSTS